MSKKRYFISVLVLICLIVFISSTTFKSSTLNTNISSKKGITPREIPVAKLIIKDINLIKDIYNFDSNNNTVSKNVELLKGSILPNNDNSIIFLAAHSGNSNISYFNDLYKLNNNSEIKFIYNSYKYLYKVNLIFEEDKDGTLEINKNYNNQLILTTCSTTSSDKQLIISSNLIKKEKI